MSTLQRRNSIPIGGSGKASSPTDGYSYFEEVIDEIRRRGAWNFIAIGLIVTFLYTVPTTAPQWWKYVMDFFGNSQFNAYVYGIAGFQFLYFCVLNSGLALIYYLELPFFEQFKTEDKPWPWKTDYRPKWFELVRRSLVSVTFNQLILGPLLTYGTWWFIEYLQLGWDVESLPSWTTCAWHLLAFMLIEDTIFYWSHRTLHLKWLYPHIHKQHHEYKTTIGIASEYAHPLEFILGNVLPFVAGPFLLRAHLLLWFMWVVVRIGETIDTHSGYTFPWSPVHFIPGMGSSEFHGYHHTRNMGNYSSMFIHWDWICGTCKGYFPHIHKRYDGESGGAKPSSEKGE